MESRANFQNLGSFLSDREQSDACSLREQPSDWSDWLFCVGYSKMTSFFMELSSLLFYSKRYGPSPSHLELVDEGDDVEEELGVYEKDFEYEENDSESE
ncbi:hypothetical protein F2Q70_00003825 [Brassica cretica]|nr:hypothetical protein F2Q70_00003825 [Brassica cretica]